MYSFQTNEICNSKNSSPGLLLLTIVRVVQVNRKVLPSFLRHCVIHICEPKKFENRLILIDPIHPYLISQSPALPDPVSR